MSIETFDWQGYMSDIGYAPEQIPNEINDEDREWLYGLWARDLMEQINYEVKQNPFFSTAKEKASEARRQFLQYAPDLSHFFGEEVQPNDPNTTYDPEAFRQHVVNNEIQNANLGYYLDTFAASRINEDTDVKWPWLKGLTKDQFKKHFMEQQDIDEAWTSVDDIRNGNFGTLAANYQAQLAQQQGLRGDEKSGHMAALKQGWYEFEKLFGYTAGTLGDATGIQWLSDIGNEIAQNVIQKSDAYNYQSKYKQSLADTIKNEGVMAAGGKILNMAEENWATTAAPLALAAIGKILSTYAHVPQPLANAATNAVAANIVRRQGANLLRRASQLAYGSSAALSGLEIGGVRAELEEKGKYDPNNVLDVVAGGLVSSSLDFIGNVAAMKGLTITASRLWTHKLAVDEARARLAKEIAGDQAKSFTHRVLSAMATEGVTEGLQEIPAMVVGARRGIEYTPKEVRDRIIDAAAVGAFMGAGIRAGEIALEKYHRGDEESPTDTDADETPETPDAPEVPPQPSQPPPPDFDGEMPFNNVTYRQTENGFVAADPFNVGYGATRNEAAEDFLKNANKGRVDIDANDIRSVPSSATGEGSSIVRYGNNGEHSVRIIGQGSNALIRKIIDIHNNPKNAVNLQGHNTFNVSDFQSTNPDLNEDQFIRSVLEQKKTGRGSSNDVILNRTNAVDIPINLTAVPRTDIAGSYAAFNLDQDSRDALRDKGFTILSNPKSRENGRIQKLLLYRDGFVYTVTLRNSATDDNVSAVVEAEHIKDINARRQIKDKDQNKKARNENLKRNSLEAGVRNQTLRVVTIDPVTDVRSTSERKSSITIAPVLRAGFVELNRRVNAEGVEEITFDPRKILEKRIKDANGKIEKIGARGITYTSGGETTRLDITADGRVVVSTDGRFVGDYEFFDPADLTEGERRASFQSTRIEATHPFHVIEIPEELQFDGRVTFVYEGDANTPENQRNYYAIRNNGDVYYISPAEDNYIKRLLRLQYIENLNDARDVFGNQFIEFYALPEFYEDGDVNQFVGFKTENNLLPVVNLEDPTLQRFSDREVDELISAGYNADFVKVYAIIAPNGEIVRATTEEGIDTFIEDIKDYANILDRSEWERPTDSVIFPTELGRYRADDLYTVMYDDNLFDNLSTDDDFREDTKKIQDATGKIIFDMKRTINGLERIGTIDKARIDSIRTLIDNIGVEGYTFPELEQLRAPIYDARTSYPSERLNVIARRRFYRIRTAQAMLLIDMYRNKLQGFVNNEELAKIINEIGEYRSTLTTDEVRRNTIQAESLVVRLEEAYVDFMRSSQPTQTTDVFWEAIYPSSNGYNYGSFVNRIHSEGTDFRFSRATETPRVRRRDSILNELQKELGDFTLNEMLEKGLRGESGGLVILPDQEAAHEIERVFTTDATQPYYGDEGLIQGFVAPDGMIYLVEDGIVDGKARQIILHEYGVHARKFGMTDAQFQEVVQNIKAKRDEKSLEGDFVRHAITRAKQANKNMLEDNPIFWEEVAAYAVEDGYHLADTGIVGRMQTWMKNWLWRFGVIDATAFHYQDFVNMAQGMLGNPGPLSFFDGTHDYTKYQDTWKNIPKFSRTILAEDTPDREEFAQRTYRRLRGLDDAIERERNGEDADSIEQATDWRRNDQGDWGIRYSRMRPYNRGENRAELRRAINELEQVSLPETIIFEPEDEDREWIDYGTYTEEEYDAYDDEYYERTYDLRFYAPTEDTIPELLRESFGVRFVRDVEEADLVQEQYEKAMSRQSDYIGNLWRHLLSRNGILYENNGSYLAGRALGNAFMISHFAPKSLKDGARMMKEVANGHMGVIAAVPPYQGSMLEKVGFRMIGQIPQIFRGELVLKNVYVNNAISDADIQYAYDEYAQGMKPEEINALIENAKIVSGKREFPNSPIRFSRIATAEELKPYKSFINDLEDNLVRERISGVPREGDTVLYQRGDVNEFITRDSLYTIEDADDYYPDLEQRWIDYHRDDSESNFIRYSRSIPETSGVEEIIEPSEQEVVESAIRYSRAGEDSDHIIKYSFVGKEAAANLSSKGWKVNGKTPLELYEIYKTMQADGEEPRKIKKETGWEYDPINKEDKFEIEDGEIRKNKKPIKDYYTKKGDEYYYLEDLLDAPVLFTAYPAMRKTKVYPKEPIDGALGEARANSMRIPGRFWEMKRKIYGLRDSEFIKEILFHEIQHIIQYHEPRFSEGAAPSMFDSAYPTREDKYDAYRRTRGEVEARNTERRLNLSLEERWNSLAEDTEEEDIPRSKQFTIERYFSNRARGYRTRYSRVATIDDVPQTARQRGTQVSNAPGMYKMPDGSLHIEPSELPVGFESETILYAAIAVSDPAKEEPKIAELRGLILTDPDLMRETDRMMRERNDTNEDHRLGYAVSLILEAYDPTSDIYQQTVDAFHEAVSKATGGAYQNLILDTGQIEAAAHAAAGIPYEALLTAPQETVPTPRPDTADVQRQQLEEAFANSDAQREYMQVGEDGRAFIATDDSDVDVVFESKVTNPFETGEIADKVLVETTEHNESEDFYNHLADSPTDRTQEPLDTGQFTAQADTMRNEVEAFLASVLPEHIWNRMQILWEDNAENRKLLGNALGNFNIKAWQNKNILIRGWDRSFGQVVRTAAREASRFGWGLWQNRDFRKALTDFYDMYTARIHEELRPYYNQMGVTDPTKLTNGQKIFMVQTFFSKLNQSLFTDDGTNMADILGIDAQEYKRVLANVRRGISAQENDLSRFMSGVAGNPELAKQFASEMLRMTMETATNVGTHFVYERANTLGGRDRIRVYTNEWGTWRNTEFETRFGKVAEQIKKNLEWWHWRYKGNPRAEKFARWMMRNLPMGWKGMKLFHLYVPDARLGDTTLGKASQMISRVWQRIGDMSGTTIQQDYALMEDIHGILRDYGYDPLVANDMFDQTGRRITYEQFFRSLGITSAKAMEKARLADEVVRTAEGLRKEQAANIRSMIVETGVSLYNRMVNAGVPQRNIQAMVNDFERKRQKFHDNYAHRMYEAFTPEGKSELARMLHYLKRDPVTGEESIAKRARRAQEQIRQAEARYGRGTSQFYKETAEARADLRRYERLTHLQNFVKAVLRDKKRLFGAELNEAVVAEMKNIINVIILDAQSIGRIDAQAVPHYNSISAQKARKLNPENDVHRELMAFLSEIKDPMRVAVYSADQQRQIIAKLQFNKELGEYLVDNGMATIRGVPSAEGIARDLAQMESGTFLEYINVDPAFMPEIKAEYENMQKVTETVLGGLTDAVKANSTVYSLRLAMNNYIGNASMLLASGHFWRFGNWMEAGGIVRKQFLDRFTYGAKDPSDFGKMIIKEMEDAMVTGGSGTEMSVFQLNKGAHENFVQMMTGLLYSGNLLSRAGKFKADNFVKRALEYARKFYTYGDEWVKPLMYINNRMNAIAKYEAIEKRRNGETEEEYKERVLKKAIEEASEMTIRETVSWENSPFFIRQLSTKSTRFFIPDFLLHNFQMLRITASNYVRLMELGRELRNFNPTEMNPDKVDAYRSALTKEFVQRGVGGAMTAGVYAGLAGATGSCMAFIPYMMNTLMAAIDGEDDKDKDNTFFNPQEWEGAQRILNYKTGGDNFFVPAWKHDGKIYAWNYGRASVMLTHAIPQPATENPEFTDYAAQFFKNIVNIGGGTIAQEIVNNAQGKDKWGREIGMEAGWGRIFDRVIVPGAVRQLLDMSVGYPGSSDNPYREGKAIKMSDAVGITVNAYDMRDIVNEVGWNMGRVGSNSQNVVRKSFLKRLTESDALSDSQIASLVSNMRESNARDFDKANYVLTGLRQMGMENKEIAHWLTVSRKDANTILSKKQANAFLKGQNIYDENLVTYLKNRRNNLAKGQDDVRMSKEELAVVLQNYDKAIRIYSQALRAQ